MGWHDCSYNCDEEEDSFSNQSSGDVELHFLSGRKWEMPDMILHYVRDHNWKPPQDFIDDVMSSELIGGKRDQSKSASCPTRIGFLEGPFETGKVPQGFIDKLVLLMLRADKMGYRTQYRSQKLGMEYYLEDSRYGIPDRKLWSG